MVFCRQWLLLDQLLRSQTGTWGYVSPSWLGEQAQRWGMQTHHIQLKGAIVLKDITANGLCLDRSRAETLDQQLGEVMAEHRHVLHQYGYMPGQKGSGKALQEILRRLDACHPQLGLARTATGAYGTSQEARERACRRRSLHPCLIRVQGRREAACRLS